MAMVRGSMLPAFSLDPRERDDAAMKDAGRVSNRAVDDGRGGTETQIDDRIRHEGFEASRARTSRWRSSRWKKTTDPLVRDFCRRR